MGEYGQAATDAILRIQSGQLSNPKDAWKQATITLFGNGTPAQTKSCPRNAFLGCCEAGLVKGIPSGHYTRSQLNKLYAVTAAQLLRAAPALASLKPSERLTLVRPRSDDRPSSTMRVNTDWIEHYLSPTACPRDRVTRAMGLSHNVPNFQAGGSSRWPQLYVLEQ